MARLEVDVHRSDMVGALEIVSLVEGSPGRLFGGLTGDHGHLFFRYDVAAGKFVDLGDRINDGNVIISFSQRAIPGKIHHALERLADGRIAGATGQNYSVSGLYTWYDEGGHVFIYDPETDSAEDLGIPCPNQWIINMTCDPAGENLYGMSYPMNYVFRVDVASGDMRVVGQPPAKAYGDSGPCHECCCDAEGNLYGSGAHRHIWRYDARRDVLEPTAMRLPEGAERIDSFVRGPDGCLYAGTWETGHVVRIDPGAGELTVLGQPAEPRKGAKAMRLPAMAWRPDGCLYGAAGGGQAYGSHNSFIFRYDPKGGSIEKIGTIESGDVLAERVHTMTCGSDGVLYAGETGSKRTAAGEVALNPNLYVCRIVD